MTIALVFLGIAALLINIFFYFKEVGMIWDALRAVAQRKIGAWQELGAAIKLFAMDAVISALVVTLAGAGVYSFIIGAIGGAVVSLVLWRKQIWAWICGCDTALVVTDTGTSVAICSDSV